MLDLSNAPLKPKINRNTAIFCMFWKFNYFPTSNSYINLGSFFKNDNFDPEQTFFRVLKNFVDFWNVNVCLHLNRPNKVIYGYFVHLWLFETHSYVLGTR